MFEIRVNGSKFDLWESATLQRSIDANAGRFRFTSTHTIPADYPVKAGDKVEVVINGVKKMTGFAERISGAMDDQTHTVTVEGRDNTCDLIDSTVPDEAKTIDPPVTMRAFCERVISALGADIPVRNVIGAAINASGATDEFGDATGITADSGRRCMEFLTSFARKQQVYLVPDGEGRLLIYRPGEDRASSPLVHEKGNPENNIKSYSVTFAHQERFRTYRARSQDNIGFEDSYDDDSVDRSGDAEDTAIRESRYLEFQAEEAMGDGEAKNRAVEEANIRKARSTDYKCTVASAAQSNGTLWDFGQLVNVRDDFAGIRGVFLIRSVEYSADIGEGTRAVLTLSPPEAYNVRVTNAVDSRKSKQGDNLQRTSPDTRRRFVR